MCRVLHVINEAALIIAAMSMFLTFVSANMDQPQGYLAFLVFMISALIFCVLSIVLFVAREISKLCSRKGWCVTSLKRV